MFSFFKKYGLLFKILAVLVFAISAYMHLYEYLTDDFETEKAKKMKLIGGIVFGLMALFQLGDLIEILKDRKKKAE